ncbi:efflux RND transporter permease subunit [Nesterenkonia haasae]|uniref:efflux RND transporter permease subunit n=1 Tax=Nesterenkonia haasae TaxID=2587813 RepID=UPI001390FFC5|nr:MMPL family transporter [Nesterenkonia haasae]
MTTQGRLDRAEGRTGLSRRRSRRGAAICTTMVLTALVLTALFALLSGEAQSASGNEGLAPDNQEVLASDTIAEQFHESGEGVLQVLVNGDDVISADGLTAADSIMDSIEASLPAEVELSATAERPAVMHWLSAVQLALAEQGMDASQADDVTVNQIFSDALESMPAEQADFTMTQLPSDASLDSSPQADSGLLLVFLQLDEAVPEHLDEAEREEARLAIDTRIAEAVRGTELPEGYSAETFSVALLIGDPSQVATELVQLFGAAFLIIFVLLGFVYWVKPGVGSRILPGIRRTIADVLLTLLTVVMAIIWMNGIGVLLGPGYFDWIGPMNDVSMIVPVLLIALGIDYAIHLTGRYREELAAGRSVGDALVRAVRTVGVALVLATVTTAVGFLMGVFNPVPALVDFGVLAAVGIVSSFVLMMTFVPATRYLIDRRAEQRATLPRQAFGRGGERLLPGIMGRIAGLAARAPVPTLLVTLVLGGSVGVWGQSQLEVRFSVTDFVQDDTPAMAVYEQLTDRFSRVDETTDVLITGDVATPQVHNALVSSLGELSEVPRVQTFGGTAQADSPVGLLATLLASADRDSPPEALIEAAEAAGLGEDLTVDPDADVAGLYDTLLTVAPDEAERVLARNDAGNFDMTRMSIQTNVGGSDVGALRENLDDALAPLVSTGVEVVATSERIIDDEIVTALTESQITTLLLALGAVLVLLVVTYWFRNRRPLLGVITVLPVGLVVLWTFATMGATGIPLGPVTATITGLAIGAGVPYTIHVTNRFQEDRLRHTSTADAIRSTMRHTGGALAGAAITNCAAFGILITSTFTPFHQLGLVTVYAVGFALFAATVVLPSMLALWDRWHRRRHPIGTTAEVPVAA